MEKKTDSPVGLSTPATSPKKKNNRNKTGRSRSYKPPVKEYKVIVTYTQVSEEEAKRKRSIIEGIIKKTYLK